MDWMLISAAGKRGREKGVFSIYKSEKDSEVMDDFTVELSLIISAEKSKVTLYPPIKRDYVPRPSENAIRMAHWEPYSR